MKSTLKKLSFAIVAIALLGLGACKKKENIIPPPADGSVKVQFSYVFGSAALPWVLNKQMVHTKTGDTLTFTTFRFYVSNVKLQRKDGSWWAQPESYYLVDANSTAASSFTIPAVPANDYVAMQYTMGVDSTRNVSGANTGALALSNGMFWDWNSGYIMLKAEGYSPNSPTNSFAFHLGGFSGENNIVTVKTADFGKTVAVGGSAPAMTVKILANPARLWHSSPNLQTRSTIHMPGPDAKIMARDFYDNITFTGVE
jgi:hypothetical protein